VIETDAKEFKIGVESELRKGEPLREVIENLEENKIKKGKKNTLLRLPAPHPLLDQNMKSYRHAPHVRPSVTLLQYYFKFLCCDIPGSAVEDEYAQ